jgi:FeS assembly SUF system protein
MHRPIAPSPADMPADTAAEVAAVVKIHPNTYEPQGALETAIITALRTVYDPEIPVNIFDLGLVYDIKIIGTVATIDMTLTAPNCPVAGEMPGMVASAAETVDGVTEATVNLVWVPAWTKDRMSEDARLALGFF